MKQALCDHHCTHCPKLKTERDRECSKVSTVNFLLVTAGPRVRQGRRAQQFCCLAFVMTKPW